MKKKNLPRKIKHRLARCRVSTAHGSELEAESVAYSCRSKPTIRVVAGEPGVRYRGKINTRIAECVDMNGTPPPALKGKTIGFHCAGSTLGPYLYPRSKTHRGMWGMLEDNVFCRVLSPLRTVPRRGAP